MEAFYQEGRDHVLNLNDARCESWSVFNDCETQSEFDAAAAALIPGDHGSDVGFWELAARTLFVEMCVELKRVGLGRSEEHTSELQSLMRISYAVFCLKKKINHSIDFSPNRTSQRLTANYDNTHNHIKVTYD